MVGCTMSGRGWSTSYPKSTTQIGPPPNKQADKKTQGKRPPWIIAPIIPPNTAEVNPHCFSRSPPTSHLIQINLRDLCSTIIKQRWLLHWGLTQSRLLLSKRIGISGATAYNRSVKPGGHAPRFWSGGRGEGFAGGSWTGRKILYLISCRKYLEYRLYT